MRSVHPLVVAAILVLFGCAGAEPSEQSSASDLSGAPVAPPVESYRAIAISDLDHDGFADAIVYNTDACVAVGCAMSVVLTSKPTLGKILATDLTGLEGGGLLARRGAHGENQIVYTLGTDNRWTEGPVLTCPGQSGCYELDPSAGTFLYDKNHDLRGPGTWALASVGDIDRDTYPDVAASNTDLLTPGTGGLRAIVTSKFGSVGAVTGFAEPLEGNRLLNRSTRVGTVEQKQRIYVLEDQGALKLDKELNCPTYFMDHDPACVG